MVSFIRSVDMRFKLLLALGFFTLATPAGALVGLSAPAPELAPYAVMVLKRVGTASGFCSASVLTQNIVLTAAHCVADTGNTRVHFHGDQDEPIIRTVAAIIKHPQFHADAVQSRRVSIDLALILLAEPLPGKFKPIALAEPSDIKIGETFRIAGFGVTQEGAAATSGILHAGVVAARLPLSSILLWAKDPQDRGTGACTGDSGGQILALNQAMLIAVTGWAEGTGQQKCGALTQATLIGPQKQWIESTVAGWASER